MSFVQEQGEGSIRLRIEGSLSIYEVGPLREELLACLESGSTLELDLSGVTDCDTAGIQLLYAARKSAGQMERDFCIRNTPESVVGTLRSAGLGADEMV